MSLRARVELFPLCNNCDSFKIKLVRKLLACVSNKASSTKRKLFKSVSAEIVNLFTRQFSKF